MELPTYRQLTVREMSIPQVQHRPTTNEMASSTLDGFGQDRDTACSSFAASSQDLIVLETYPKPVTIVAYRHKVCCRLIPKAEAELP